jgi:NAD(P)-dependent dehydrogenase (short-subunit alcohol dehydrogenase family)
VTDVPRDTAAFSLSGKKALVTGGNRGLGFAFTQTLADCGAAVAFIGRSADANAAAVARLDESGVRAHAIGADLARDEDVERAVGEAIAALGGLDIVVNNAGTCFHNPAWEATDEQWQPPPGKRPTTPPRPPSTS